LYGRYCTGSGKTYFAKELAKRAGFEVLWEGVASLLNRGYVGGTEACLAGAWRCGMTTVIDGIDVCVGPVTTI
jgi:hypothetical protein